MSFSKSFSSKYSSVSLRQRKNLQFYTSVVSNSCWWPSLKAARRGKEILARKLSDQKNRIFFLSPAVDRLEQDTCPSSDSFSTTSAIGCNQYLGHQEERKPSMELFQQQLGWCRLHQCRYYSSRPTATDGNPGGRQGGDKTAAAANTRRAKSSSTSSFSSQQQKNEQKNDNDKEKEEEEKGRKKVSSSKDPKFLRYMKQYGLPFTIWYLIVEEGTLVFLVCALHYHWFGPNVDAAALLNYFGVKYDLTGSSWHVLGLFELSARFMVNVGAAGAIVGVLTPVFVPFCLVTLGLFKKLPLVRRFFQKKKVVAVKPSS